MTTPPIITLFNEEDVVAALEAEGVTYLSRNADTASLSNMARWSSDELLEAVLKQPSARVRSAIIALLIVHPSLWRAADALHRRLIGEARNTLMLYYTAARLLQGLHSDEIRARNAVDWEPLPDLFGDFLKLPPSGPLETQLQALAAAHRRISGRSLNWEGTYRSAAGHLLRQWQLEATWTR